ncbi:hypothetical protein LCGC14_1531850 [marine sediment metagenome]|uniref:Uncharacterized protein n=1 Tax=marine sediment metagenome TaxID=412755 RepID=A0A0F9LBI2_9ZZZZ
MGHTEGPWHYIQYGDGDNAIITSEGDGRICELVTNEPVAVRDANARLIAAAPEMLDALKRFCNKDDMDFMGCVQACNRAIAKAEGNG